MLKGQCIVYEAIKFLLDSRVWEQVQPGSKYNLVLALFTSPGKKNVFEGRGMFTQDVVM